MADHKASSDIIFQTGRLTVRGATSDDATLIHRLWSDPRVTTYVGFPQGIPTTIGEIEAQIARDRERPLARLLVAERTSDGAPIGQVKLGSPDERGISEPDIKLLPQHWGSGYGRELWSAMIEWLFRETDCQAVQGTPNVTNTASIRMMESCGMARVGSGVFDPPGSMEGIMVAVPHFVYRITRPSADRASAAMRL